MKVQKKSKVVLLTIVGIILAVYILFPFYLVVMNSFKKQTAIVANPISTVGASFSQFVTNVTSVANNSNFNFWSAFATSAIITVVSLFLLAIFGAMAAWVISRNNKKKWATAIYMIFIRSNIITLFFNNVCLNFTRIILIAVIHTIAFFISSEHLYSSF